MVSGIAEATTAAAVAAAAAAAEVARGAGRVTMRLVRTERDVPPLVLRAVVLAGVALLDDDAGEGVPWAQPRWTVSKEAVGVDFFTSSRPQHLDWRRTRRV